MSVVNTVAKRRRIGVLMGGTSAEREVSLRSGAAVAEALEARGHEVLRLDVDRDIDRTLRMARKQGAIDVAFIALHGTLGEDGCIQGLLECLGIPYTGSGVLASALAMDKVKAKELFRLHNVPTPPYYVARPKDLDDVEALHGSFGFPAIVKPRREGSSIGISKASTTAELSTALRRAFEHGDEAIVERFVAGSEVQVGILGGRVLGAIEIVPKRPFYDFVAKYTPGMAEYHLPARLSPTRMRGVLNLAERATRALGTDGAVRVDLLVTEGENEYVLEVNTLPGMTETSLLPKIAQAAGYEFGALCEAIVDLAKLHVNPLRAGAESSATEAAQRPVTASVIRPERKLRVAARSA